MSTDPDLNPSDYQLLSAYIDGALNASERKRVERRLEQEPGLRQELDELRETIRLVEGLPTLKAPHDFTLTEDMLARHRRGMAPRAARIRPLPALGALSAAAAVVLIALGLLLLGGGFQDTSETYNTEEGVSVAAQPTATPTEARAEATATVPQAGANLLESRAEQAATSTETTQPVSPPTVEPEVQSFSVEPSGSPEAMMESQLQDQDMDQAAPAPRAGDAPRSTPPTVAEAEGMDDAAGAAPDVAPETGAGANALGEAAEAQQKPTATTLPATPSPLPTLTATASPAPTEVAERPSEDEAQAEEALGDAAAVESAQAAEGTQTTTAATNNETLAFILIGIGIVLLIAAGLIFARYRRTVT